MEGLAMGMHHPGELREQVRARYAAAATLVTADEARGCGEECTCGPQDLEQPGFGATGYGAAERAEVPERAVQASLGCGNPLAVAVLRAGETVLDLGSGGGIDVLLSARRVGPAGFAYGLDMTDEMLALARENARASGVTNVEFLKGHIEDIPLPEGTVDVVISNCVINLSVDKPAVFAATYRVLKRGGRIGISDVVADDHLSVEERAARGAFVGCIAGALSISEYRAGLSAAGFTSVEIVPTQQVADGMRSAIIRAIKPAADDSDPAR
jgi:arsenite methyltransferase